MVKYYHVHYDKLSQTVQTRRHRLGLLERLLARVTLAISIASQYRQQWLTFANPVLVDIAIFIRKRSKRNIKSLYSSYLHYCSKGDRCPSATARSTAGGTQGCLDLELGPLIHIIEEHSKESPKLQRSQPITTEYGELNLMNIRQFLSANIPYFCRPSHTLRRK